MAYLYLNFVCNNNCLFCASDLTNQPTAKKEFSLDEAVQFMDRERKNDTHALLINGGEPTIHKDILQIIRAGKARFDSVFMASNGIRFADNDFALAAKLAGLDGVGTPIYSTSAQKFDYLVQHPGAYEQVIKGLHNLFTIKQKYGLSIMLKVLVMKPNYMENPDIVSMIRAEFPETDQIGVAGLRVGAKAFSRVDELFIPYNVARPYTTEAIRRILPKPLSLDFLPLCGIDSNLVLDLIKQGWITGDQRFARLERPDGYRKQGVEPFHEEHACSECYVYGYCSKIHTKHSQELGYKQQLHAIKIK